MAKAEVQKRLTLLQMVHSRNSIDAQQEELLENSSRSVRGSMDEKITHVSAAGAEPSSPEPLKSFEAPTAKGLAENRLWWEHLALPACSMSSESVESPPMAKSCLAQHRMPIEILPSFMVFIRMISWPFRWHCPSSLAKPSARRSAHSVCGLVALPLVAPLQTSTERRRQCCSLTTKPEP